MKSKNSPLRLSASKTKLNPAKSSSVVQGSNRSSTDLFAGKKISALHLYNNIFGKKYLDSSHIGDPNTHFKKSLRQYNEFSPSKHAKWIRQHIEELNNIKVNQTEVRKGAGDFAVVRKRKRPSAKSSVQSVKEQPAETETAVKEVEDKETEEDTEETEEDTEEEAEAESDVKSEEKVQQTEEKVVLEEKVEKELEVKSEKMAEDESQIEETEKELAEEDVPALEEIQDMVKEVEQEMDIGETEDFQEMLHKSVAEMEKAVTDLDKEKTSAAEPPKKKEGEGDGGGAVFPQMDNKVLKELEEAEVQARAVGEAITAIKDRVAELLKKDHMTDVEARELEKLNKELRDHMAVFEDKTRLIQMLVQVADQYLKTTPPIDTEKRHKEDMLPKVVICGVTDDNMPKILICDGPTAKRPGSRPDGDHRRRSSTDRRRSSTERRPSEGHQSIQQQPHVMPHIAKCLSESYDMQEKLAQDNVDLEGKRYRLQEELLQKDRAVECLQRQVCGLHAEMRMVLKENQGLKERVDRLQGKCKPVKDMPCGGGRGICAADVENRLQHYSQTTSGLEKHVEGMEEEVRRMSDELNCVKRERAEMERRRQQEEAERRKKEEEKFSCGPPGIPPCMPGCTGPCRNAAGPTSGMAEQQLRELREQYNRLQDDYKAKLTEVAGLRADNDMMKRTADQAERLKKECETKMQEYERHMKSTKNDANKLMGSKEMLMEQEQQLAVAKQRFREAQDELDELRACIQDQATQLDDYRNKYLVAQQQVEEQRRQIDVMEMENQRIAEQVTCEIQRVKNQFQEKLAELSPLPDILKATQMKLQEEQHIRSISDRNLDAVTRELQMYKDKLACMASQMEKQRSDQQLGEDERHSLMSQMNGWECKCNDLQQNCDKMKTDLARAEEQLLQNEKRLEEKLHEIAQLTAQLETVREESARQVARTKERCETVRRSLQGQVAEMERQLAQARAAAKLAQKERDDVRHKMQAQISNLNENFEEAQLRIRTLQGHVNFLNTSYPSMFEGADPMSCSAQPPDNDDICNCGSTFN